MNQFNQIQRRDSAILIDSLKCRLFYKKFNSKIVADRMGNGQGNKLSLQFQFFQSCEDPLFGPSIIYRNKNNPNLFALALSQDIPQFIKKNMQLELQQLQFHKHQSPEQYPFLKIINYSSSSCTKDLPSKILTTCSQNPQTTIWIEYLRHNFKQFIAWRKLKNRPLSLEQIVIVLKRAIKAFEITKTHEFFGLNLKLQNISITVGGQILFNPILGKFMEKLFISEKKHSNLCPIRNYRNSSLQSRMTLKKKFLPDKHQREVNSEILLQSYFSQESIFLKQLKDFCNQIIWDLSFCKIQNPENSEFDKRNLRKSFLLDFYKICSIKEAKSFFGPSKINVIETDFSKQAYEEQQSKFCQILSEMEKRSQKTDQSFLTEISQSYRFLVSKQREKAPVLKYIKGEISF